MRILYVEDQVEPAKLIRSLEMRGHTVCWAKTPGAATHYAIEEDGEAFDALILDMEMNRQLLPLALRENVETAGMPAGLVLYSWLLPDDSPLKKRTILFSGFIHLFYKQIERLQAEKPNSLIRVVDKNDINYEKRIFSFLGEIEVEMAAERDSKSREER